MSFVFVQGEDVSFVCMQGEDVSFALYASIRCELCCVQGEGVSFVVSKEKM